MIKRPSVFSQSWFFYSQCCRRITPSALKGVSQPMFVRNVVEHLCVSWSSFCITPKPMWRLSATSRSSFAPPSHFSSNIGSCLSLQQSIKRVIHYFSRARLQFYIRPWVESTVCNCQKREEAVACADSHLDQIFSWFGLLKSPKTMAAIKSIYFHISDWTQFSTLASIRTNTNE